MKNNVYKNFSKMKFNEKENFDIIMSKIDNSKRNKNVKHLNVASIVIIAMLISCLCPVIYAKYQLNIQFKEYKNREYEVGYTTLEDINQNGYIENIDMNYIIQNDIGVRIDSLLMDNDYLELKLNFIFPENLIIDSENFSYGFAIYDENNNIYGIIPRTNIIDTKAFTNYTKNMYNELNVNYNPLDIFSIQLNAGVETQNLSAQNYEITSKICMNGLKDFPQSKKIFVRIFDLGFYTYTTEERLNLDFEVSDSEWIFELDIPEKFYNENDIEMTIKDVIPGININEITVDNIRMKIILEWNEYEKFILENDASSIHKFINITDENGNIYYMTNGRETNGIITRYFAINKNMLNNKLFLNIELDNKIYTTELILK